MTEVAPCHQRARNPCPSAGNDSNLVNFMLSAHVMEFNHDKFMKSNSCSYKCGHMVQVYQRDTLFNCPALESSTSLHIDVPGESTYSCELRRNATVQGLSSFRPCYILEPQ